MGLSKVDRELRENFKYICGVDEAGRGPLAGPVYAAAVILPDDFECEYLDDSKKLSEKRREKLYDIITENAVAWSVGSASETEIDEINILNATYLAMNRAIDGLAVKAEFALIDGNRSTGIALQNRCVVGGDGKYLCIAATSILAKVSRDRYMRELAAIYPQYEFEKHKGYGTKRHYECIRQHGISPAHRKSFLKKLYLTEQK